MRILKILIIAFLLFVILGALYISTLKSSYLIHSSTTINAPISMVYNEVSNLRNWENWGPWFKDDKTVALSFPNLAKGKNAELLWTGKNGSGSIKTLSEILNKEIVQLFTFDNNTANMIWSFTPNHNNTAITWTVNGTKSFSEKIYWLLKGGVENNIKLNLKGGLEQLNNELVLKMEKHSLEIKGIVDYGGGYYLYQTTHSNLEDISAKTSEMFSEIENFMTENNIRPAGDYFTLNHSIDQVNNTFMFSVCVPVRERIATTGNVLIGYLEPQQTFKAVFYGNYLFLPQSWPLIYKALNETGFEAVKKGYSFEIYTVNPKNTPNPAAWITEIYIPVK
jgi:effector-binding domain-containing protein